MPKTCENCQTKEVLGCSAYRSEDCGTGMKEWKACTACVWYTFSLKPGEFCPGCNNLDHFQSK
jgi:hypothetical protein